MGPPRPPRALAAADPACPGPETPPRGPLPTWLPRFCISSVLSGTGAQRDLRLPSTAATVASGAVAHISCSMAAVAWQYKRWRCHLNSQALGPSRYSS